MRIEMGSMILHKDIAGVLHSRLGDCRWVMEPGLIT